MEHCGTFWNIVENFGNFIVKWKKRREEEKKGERKEGGRDEGERGRKERKEYVCGHVVVVVYL